MKYLLKTNDVTTYSIYISKLTD